MTDIAIQLLDDGSNFAPALYKGDLIRDDSLRTAILVSLFTDAEATAEQLAAAGLDPTDRRGWWGDALSAVPGDRIGSLLWLLDRRKKTADVLPEAKQYAQDALAWMVSTGVASAVSVTVTLDDTFDLLFDVSVARPTGNEQYRVSGIWAANFAPDNIAVADAEADSYADLAAAFDYLRVVEFPEIFV